MPKVFIPNKSIHDYSAAEAFGELVYLSEGNLDRFNVSGAYRMFYPKLLESTPYDYILVTGLPMLNLVVCHIMTALHGRINLLLFQPKGGKKNYVERVIESN